MFKYIFATLLFLKRLKGALALWLPIACFVAAAIRLSFAALPSCRAEPSRLMREDCWRHFVDALGFEFLIAKNLCVAYTRGPIIDSRAAFRVRLAQSVTSIGLQGSFPGAGKMDCARALHQSS